MAGDDRLQLAYEAGQAALAQQDATLGNVRNRTTGLLTTAGLATSFAAGIGLINTDPTKGVVFPVWAAITLLCQFAAIGIISVVVLWPVQFGFGPDSALILNMHDKNNGTDEILRFVTKELTDWRGKNARKIALRMKAFEAGCALLVAEIGVLIAALAIR